MTTWYRLLASIPTANSPHDSLSTRRGFDHVAFHGGAAVGDGFGFAVGESAGRALGGQEVRVIGLKAPGAGGELDALTVATGGSVQALSSDGANIGAAIVAGLGNLEIEVSMASDCSDPISVTFDPASQVVTSGEDAVFTETISVAADAAQGETFECDDWALINGEPMTDAEP